MENVKDAFIQMSNNWQLIVAVAGLCVWDVVIILKIRFALVFEL